jgi:hypothetical protein
VETELLPAVCFCILVQRLKLNLIVWTLLAGSRLEFKGFYETSKNAAF